jgi:putative addiction module antidote
MTYKQKLTKIGNSAGIIIPKDMRELLGIKLGAEIYIHPSSDNKTLILNPQKPTPDIDPQFFDLVKKVDEKYSRALQELASK